MPQTVPSKFINKPNIIRISLNIIQSVQENTLLSYHRVKNIEPGVKQTELIFVMVFFIFYSFNIFIFSLSQ